MTPPPGQADAQRCVGVEAGTDDAERWREATALRQQWPKWVVIWLAPMQRFRAYRRLPGARRDTTLTAFTAADLGILIGQAEDSARARTRRQAVSAATHEPIHRDRGK